MLLALMAYDSFFFFSLPFLSLILGESSTNAYSVWSTLFQHVNSCINLMFKSGGWWEGKERGRQSDGGEGLGNNEKVKEKTPKKH